MLNRDVTREEFDLILSIAKRAVQQEVPYPFGGGIGIDLMVTHCNGCRINLASLLNAYDRDFFHDIAGIGANLNRETGKLENLFLPRYAEIGQRKET